MENQTRDDKEWENAVNYHREQDIILQALICYAEFINRSKRVLVEREEIDSHLNEVDDLIVKLTLELLPITIKSNNCLIRETCPLCGHHERPETPEWAFVNDRPICFQCFEKHAPDLYEQVCARNAKAYEEYQERHPVEASEDSLPF